MVARYALAILLILAAPAAAHEVQSGPNGGRVVEAGSYHVELVTRGETVELFLMDANDRPVAPAGFRATAVLIVEGRSQRVTLEAASDRLTGRAAASVPASVRGAVQLTAPNGQTVQARFN